MYYSVQLNQSISDIENLTFSDANRMMEFYIEKIQEDENHYFEYHLFLVRKLAFSIMQFFPEKVKGRLKETDFYPLPTYDKLYAESDKEETIEEMRERVKKRFEKMI